MAQHPTPTREFFHAQVLRASTSEPARRAHRPDRHRRAVQLPHRLRRPAHTRERRHRPQLPLPADRRHREPHRLQPRQVPDLDHHRGHLRHPRVDPQAGRHQRRHRLRLQGHQRQLVLAVRRRDLDRRLRRRHRPPRAARRGLGLGRGQVDDGPAAGVRQRRHPPPAARGHRQRQPVQGRPGPGHLGPVPLRLRLHLCARLGPGEVLLRPVGRLGREERAAELPGELLSDPGRRRGPAGAFRPGPASLSRPRRPRRPQEAGRRRIRKPAAAPAPNSAARDTPVASQVAPSQRAP
ncbi:conserved hypothetical protein [Streptomyces misionensis JCM 4497]